MKSKELADNADVLGIAVFLGDAELIKRCLDDKDIQKRYSRQTLKEAAEYAKSLA